MEIIDYPEWFPLPQKADKNMTFDTGFRTDQPQVGSPIFQKLTDDIKTTWNVKWIFTLDEERAFQQWLRSPNYLDNCNKWFRMLVNLGGSGLQPQVLHFINGYPVQTSINGNAVTWTGTVICRKLFNEDDEFGDLIVEIPPRDWGLLDIVVTERLPRCKGDE
ncbi:hypothetical protein M0I01_RS12725 [Providencia rettgeri]|nr:hypothetical protein [Providencia rettgeri]